MAVPIDRVRKFHAGRLALWTAQLPLALVLLPSLQSSLRYLVFLSIAALIESALTDWLQARQAERENPEAEL